MSSPSKHPARYTVAAVSGAMAAFELAASVLARNGPSCSSILRNTLSIPMTLTEYVDDRMVKRSDEPLWIDNFVVEHQMPEYFCRDTGFRWAMPLVIYMSAALFLYQRFRGNRTQDAIIVLYAFLGALVGGIAGYDFLDILSGLVPGAIWLSLVCMPLHIEENWKEKQGEMLDKIPDWLLGTYSRM